MNGTNEMDISGVNNILLMVSIVPILAIIMCIVLLKVFPLQGEKYKEFRKNYLEFLESGK